MKKFTLIVLTTLALIISSIKVFAFNIPIRPENGFYDPHGYISTETKNKLVDFNEKHKFTDQTQLGIAIVDTLDGENIEDVANKIATSWEMGYEDSNRGALLLIAINDRKFRIETSTELRKVITDWDAAIILDDSQGAMRNQHYDTAVQLIMNGIEKELIKDPADTETNELPFPVVLLLFVPVLLLFFIPVVLLLLIPVIAFFIMSLKTTYHKVCAKVIKTNKRT